jgi:glutamyl/glutaminyl-tRNA synthetase
MNTRFCPTTNGYLHIGHAYVALVNAHEARVAGGVMHLLLDDLQPYWIQQLGFQQITQYSLAAAEDLRWLGVLDPGTSIISQYRASYRVEEAVRRCRVHANQLTGDVPHDYERALFSLASEPDRHFYPYVPYLTACKVAWDHLLGVGHVIRGDDLITEMSLYAYFRERLGYPIPEQTFLPRLRLREGELTDVSKTAGNWKLRDLREQGWTPDRVVNLLADSCLINPAAGWSCANVKPSPTLEIV